MPRIRLPNQFLGVPSVVEPRGLPSTLNLTEEQGIEGLARGVAAATLSAEQATVREYQQEQQELWGSALRDYQLLQREFGVEREIAWRKQQQRYEQSEKRRVKREATRFVDSLFSFYQDAAQKKRTEKIKNQEAIESDRYKRNSKVNGILLKQKGRQFDFMLKDFDEETLQRVGTEGADAIARERFNQILAEMDELPTQMLPGLDEDIIEMQGLRSVFETQSMDNPDFATTVRRLEAGFEDLDHRKDLESLSALRAAPVPADAETFQSMLDSYSSLRDNSEHADVRSGAERGIQALGHGYIQSFLSEPDMESRMNNAMEIAINDGGFIRDIASETGISGEVGTYVGKAMDVVRDGFKEKVRTLGQLDADSMPIGDGDVAKELRRLQSKTLTESLAFFSNSTLMEAIGVSDEAKLAVQQSIEALKNREIKSAAYARGKRILAGELIATEEDQKGSLNDHFREVVLPGIVDNEKPIEERVALATEFVMEAGSTPDMDKFFGSLDSYNREMLEFGIQFSDVLRRTGSSYFDKILNKNKDLSLMLEQFRYLSRVEEPDVAFDMIARSDAAADSKTFKQTFEAVSKQLDQVYGETNPSMLPIARNILQAYMSRPGNWSPQAHLASTMNAINSQFDGSLYRPPWKEFSTELGFLGDEESAKSAINNQFDQFGMTVFKDKWRGADAYEIVAVPDPRFGDDKPSYMFVDNSPDAEAPGKPLRSPDTGELYLVRPIREYMTEYREILDQRISDSTGYPSSIWSGKPPVGEAIAGGETSTAAILNEIRRSIIDDGSWYVWEVLGGIKPVERDNAPGKEERFGKTGFVRGTPGRFFKDHYTVDGEQLREAKRKYMLKQLDELSERGDLSAEAEETIGDFVEFLNGAFAKHHPILEVEEILSEKGAAAAYLKIFGIEDTRAEALESISRSYGIGPQAARYKKDREFNSRFSEYTRSWRLSPNQLELLKSQARPMFENPEETGGLDMFFSVEPGVHLGDTVIKRDLIRK